MSRTWWGRSFAALLSLWFAVVSAEPAFLTCPVHDGAAHDAAQLVGAPQEMHGHAGHAHAPAGPAPHSAGRHAHHGCTCLGTCCAAAPVTVPDARTALVATEVSTPIPPPRRPDAQYRPSAPEHARPPSLGPPALHIG